MNTPNKYSKLIARILSIICFILFVFPVMGVITSMTEVLNECSGNTCETTSSSNQEATLEWYDSWRQNEEPWYENIKYKDYSKDNQNVEISSSLTPLGTNPLKHDLLSKTMKALAEIEAKEASEETIIVTTVAEMTITEPVTEAQVIQNSEVNNEPTYIEEVIIEASPEPEQPKDEELPIEEPVLSEPPAQDYNNNNEDESWYYPILLTHDGYETTWDKENQRILKNYCDQYGVDYELMLAIIAKESGYNQYAQSYCGAMGLCQVMPITCREFNNRTGIYYDDYYSIEANLHVGVYVMKLGLDKYGNMYDACTSYNQGLYSSGVGYYCSYSESVLALRDRILALKA